MKQLIVLAIITFFLTLFSFCQSQEIDVIVAASRTNEYFPIIKNKKVGLVVNQTSYVGNTHLLDTLVNSGIDVKAVFSPEHGFRGKADAGETILDGKDIRTKTPIISLYGKNKKPTKEQLEGINLMIFDIQDVGIRFYTYISTLHYIMQACAEQNIPLLILDRPNPNGNYVDGPVLDTNFRSFVGMHPIPIVHGLTIGEIALMINGENWLGNNLKCEIIVIPNENWNHNTNYSLPISPSPNLPNDQSIILYPSLCFFEATDISIGRGTYFPFQVIGFPDKKFGEFQFTPESIIGMSKHPKQENKICYGLDLRAIKPIPKFTLQYFITFYNKAGENIISRERWFNLLAGNSTLQEQIINGLNEEDIRKSWSDDLKTYKAKRKKYLLYTDFE